MNVWNKSPPVTKTSAGSLRSTGVVTDHEKYQKIAKQHRDMQPVVEKFREYQLVTTGIADAQDHAGRETTPTCAPWRRKS